MNILAAIWLALIVLKLLGVLLLSWWVILAPVWIYLILCALVYTVSAFDGARRP